MMPRKRCFMRLVARVLHERSFRAYASTVEYRNPSLKDVAEAAGVHPATASRALKNDRRITEATRLRVLSAAEALGYRTDPLVSLLMSHRRTSTTPDFQGVIAYVTRYTTPGEWQGVSESFTRIHHGAAAAADRQGYALEEFCVPPVKGAAASFQRMAIARGIQCILIAPLPKPNGHLRMDWDKFHTIGIGYSLIRPEIHRVATDHFGCLVVATRQARRRGYRRIGVTLNGQVNERTDRRWLGALMVEHQRSRPEERIPPLVTRDWDETAFRKWVLKHRPDAIMGVHMYRVADGLEKMGLRVPEDIGLISLELRDREKGMSGIDQNFEQIGATAVHQVIGMFHRGERGLPSAAQKNLIDGNWVDGNTLLGPVASAPH